MNDVFPLADESITDCLKTLSLDGALVAMDYDGQCLMEFDDFTAFVGQPWVSLWPTENRHLVTAAVERARSGKVARFNANCPTAKGCMKSWEVSVAPLRDAGGVIVALQSLSHDVTRRERDIRERVLVSHELAHRIKNLFSIVDSLVHLSSRAAPEARVFVEGFRQRLTGLSRAISFIHPFSEDDARHLPRTVRGLITALVLPYEKAGSAIVLEGDDALINQGAVTSLAMVVNELATNAVKYGALKGERGCITVTLTRKLDVFELDWAEHFPRDPNEAATPGFGTGLLDRTVRHQLAGSISRTWTDAGLQVRMILPLSALVANGSEDGLRCPPELPQ